jgi:hypothetical protein
VVLPDPPFCEANASTRTGFPLKNWSSMKGDCHARR